MFFLKLTNSEGWNSGLETPTGEHLTQFYWPTEEKKKEKHIRQYSELLNSNHSQENLSEWVSRQNATYTVKSYLEMVCTEKHK